MYGIARRQAQQAKQELKKKRQQEKDERRQQRKAERRAQRAQKKRELEQKYAGMTEEEAIEAKGACLHVCFSVQAHLCAAKKAQTDFERRRNERRRKALEQTERRRAAIERYLKAREKAVMRGEVRHCKVP